LRVVRFNPEAHYEMIASWFKGHGWDMPPARSILPRESGFLIEKDGRYIACTFLYISNSPLCWQEWTAVDPKARPREKLQAVKKLIEYIKWFVKELHPENQVMTLLATKSLTRIFQREGYKVTEKASLVHWA